MIHKVGDLVECTWQPRVSHYNSKSGSTVYMSHVIKDEFGIIVSVSRTDTTRCCILFPQYNYMHTLVEKAFINYSARSRERDRIRCKSDLN